MSDQLARYRVPHELLVLPDRGHGFDGEDRGLKSLTIAKVFDPVVKCLETHAKLFA
jgi:hypothetical protein